MASTKSRLSHWNSVCVRASQGAQMAQLSMVGTSSLAIMLTFSHALSADQASCSH